MPTGRWLRALASLAFAVAITSVPMARVTACTCAMGDLGAAMRDARLAFVGTVLDRRDTGALNELDGRLTDYAFRVERASAETPEITLVRAGGSEASCGVTFALGEEWLVVLPPRGDLGDRGVDTHLCAGNTRMVDIQPHHLADLNAVLTVAPTPTQSDSGGAPVGVLLAGGAVLLGWLGVALLASRRALR